MKKPTIISILLILVFSVQFTVAQLKYQPKVLVVVLGPKNSTFDESQYPKMNFYYTPDLKLKISKKASENKKTRAFSSALGIGRTARAEDNLDFTGEPLVISGKSIHPGWTYLFDKNGIINGRTWNNPEGFSKNTKFMVEFKSLQRTWVDDTFDNLMKSLIKKGDTRKPAKKKKKDSGFNEVGFPIEDFQVYDKESNEYNIKNLVQGNPATVVMFVYLNPEYDLSNNENDLGEIKKGSEFANKMAEFTAAAKQVAPIENMQNCVFGK